MKKKKGKRKKKKTPTHPSILNYNIISNKTMAAIK